MFERLLLKNGKSLHQRAGITLEPPKPCPIEATRPVEKSAQHKRRCARSIPENSTGSCGMMVNLERKSSRPICQKPGPVCIEKGSQRKSQVTSFVVIVPIRAMSCGECAKKGNNSITKNNGQETRDRASPTIMYLWNLYVMSEICAQKSNPTHKA